MILHSVLALSGNLYCKYKMGVAVQQLIRLQTSTKLKKFYNHSYKVFFSSDHHRNENKNSPATGGGQSAGGGQSEPYDNRASDNNSRSTIVGPT